MYIDRYEKWDEEKWQCEKRKRKWNWNENKYLVIKMYKILSVSDYIDAVVCASGCDYGWRKKRAYELLDARQRG